MQMHLYCVRLRGIKPGTNECQTMIVNDVMASNEKKAGEAAIDLCAIRTKFSEIQFVSARCTDDAKWM